MRQICLTISLLAFGMLLTAQQVIFIDAGGPEDQYYSPADGGASCFTQAPGMTCSYTRAIMGAGSLSTLRYGFGGIPFTYTVPTISGTCDVKVTMVEPNKTAVGQRIFTITISGAGNSVSAISPPIDLFSLTGGDNIAYVYENKSVTSSGTVTILFTPSAGNALVNQIDLICTSPTSGTITDAQFNALMQTWLMTHTSSVQSTASTITMQPGGVYSPSTGNSIYATIATITVTGGSDTGRFWAGYNGQGQRMCWYGPGISPANYKVDGFAGQACSTPIPLGIYTSATVPVANGVFGPPNDFRTDAVSLQ